MDALDPYFGTIVVTIRTNYIFGMKCPVCKQERPDELFLSITGKRVVATCAKCRGQRIAFYHSRHPTFGDRAELQREHRYNLPFGDFNRLKEEQKGRCALCDKITKQFHVDHCHETGKVRGLLCGNCNKGLGFLGDNLAGLLLAVEYLKRTA